MSYVTAGGRGVVREWYDEQSTRTKAVFYARLEYLLSSERMDWKREPYAQLKGYKALGEIRFFAEKVQQRPIGFFGPGDGEFTILLHAFEKGGKLKPRGCLDVAEQRKDDVLNGRASVVACDWLWDDEDEEAAQ